jgi:hypothetical protein
MLGVKENAMFFGMVPENIELPLIKVEKVAGESCLWQRSEFQFLRK